MSTLFEAVGHQATKPSGEIESGGSDLKRFKIKCCCFWMFSLIWIVYQKLRPGYSNILKELMFWLFSKNNSHNFSRHNLTLQENTKHNLTLKCFLY